MQSESESEGELVAVRLRVRNYDEDNFASSVSQDLNNAFTRVFSPQERELLEQNVEQKQPAGESEKLETVQCAPLFTETSDFKLPCSPQEAVIINDAHRREDAPDGEGSDLWTIAQISPVIGSQYGFTDPLFAPSQWGCIDEVIKQEDYNATFFGFYPELQTILPRPNVCVCGGAAAWPMKRSQFKPSDVDFFLYGLPTDESEASRKARWDCVLQLVKAIRREFPQCLESMSAGIISIKAFRNASNGRSRRRSSQKSSQGENSHIKFQIILRAYHTRSAIVHGFDVPSCCFVFDGQTTGMTTLAAYSHIMQANIVVPAYRSTTYEQRLWKYFKRGFALILPFLDLTQIKVHQDIVLPHLILKPRIHRENFIYGSISLLEDVNEEESDYIPSEIQKFNNPLNQVCTFGQNHTNFKMVLRKKPLVMFGFYLPDATVRNFSFRREMTNGIRFEALVSRTGEMKTEDVFSKRTFQEMLNIKTVWNTNMAYHVNWFNLRRIFGLEADEIDRIYTEVRKTLAKHPSSKIDLKSKILETKKNALLEKYNEYPKTIEWWILTNPTRQFTSSLHPCAETQSDWYGKSFAFSEYYLRSKEEQQAILSKSRDGVMESRLVKSHAETANNAGDNVCAICFEEVNVGSNNTVILPCGHAFHLSPESKCNGVAQWLLKKSSCPTCRRDVGSGETERYSHPSRRGETITIRLP